MLEGTLFELPSLGSMSREALFKTCCAISDVDDPSQLDMASEHIFGKVSSSSSASSSMLLVISFLLIAILSCS